MHTRTQEKGAVTPQETDRDLPVSAQESPAEMELVAGACCRVRSTECDSVYVGPFEGCCHCLHSLTIPLLQVKQQGGIQSSSSTENWIKDLLSMASSIRIRPSLPLSQSLTLESFHKSVIFLLQRADRMKTTVTVN